MIEAIQKKENPFSWWMPAYTTLLVMGLFILVMYRIGEAAIIGGVALLLTLIVMLHFISSNWRVFFEVTLEENMEFGAAIMIFMILLGYPLVSQRIPS